MADVQPAEARVGEHRRLLVADGQHGLRGGDGGEREGSTVSRATSRAFRDLRARRIPLSFSMARRDSLRRRMAAKIIDGKALAAKVRTQVREDVAAFAAEHGHPPGPGDRARGRGRGQRDLRQRQAEGHRGGGHGGFDHRLPADASRDEVVGAHRRLNANAEVSGILRAAAGARAPRRRRADRAGRPRQGRRRADADERRAARARPPGPTPVHADGRDAAARRRRAPSSRAPRPSSSAARTCSASRWLSCCSAPTPP